MHRTLFLITLSLTAGWLWAQTDGFARYQVILDKHMFGQPRPTPKPAPVSRPTPAPVAVAWAKDYRVTMMVEDEKTGEVEVGLQNLKDHSGYLLQVGDNPAHCGGFELLRADFEQKIAVVAYQGSQHQFTQEAGPSVVAQPGKSAKTTPARTVGRTRMPVRKPAVRPTPRPRVQPRYEGAELDNHLRNYNEEVIRQGLPALPIPLTAEQDARLVREGFLPPQ